MIVVGRAISGDLETAPLHGTSAEDCRRRAETRARARQVLTAYGATDLFEVLGLDADPDPDPIDEPVAPARPSLAAGTAIAVGVCPACGDTALLTAARLIGRHPPLRVRGDGQTYRPKELCPGFTSTPEEIQ